jgi:PEP-CTERM motif
LLYIFAVFWYQQGTEIPDPLMKTFRMTLLASLLAGMAVTVQSATYSGNGNSGFGGPIGLGSLTLTDNGTTVSGTVNKGPNGFNDVLVLYIDSSAGGFADTSGFGDGADGLRKAISGFDGAANRSLLTFGGGFSPDYAMALGPSSDSFGGLWQLANGGANSLNFINSVNLNPTGNNNSPTYTFSFNVSDIGLSPNSGATFRLFGTYISNSGFRSDEAVAGNDVGAQGWNPFLQTAFVSYTIVPEPSAAALLGLGVAASVVLLRRR